MQLHLICVGRLKAGPERDLVGHYVTRAGGIGRGLGISLVDMREIDESRARRPADRKKEEAKAIRSLMAGQSATAAGFIACDETGENLTSADLAHRLGQLRDQGAGHLCLVIGGPDGLDPDLSAEASLRLAFGAMTWPHQLARIMAAEQVYRALTLLAGHPYHRS
jgi:23S rRNA (pseudouridine1915-N3)-methyltransferase